MLSKKKKFLILGIMVVLLGVTAYLNVALNNKVVDTTSNTVTTASFFATYRNDRQTTRDQEIAYYDAIISSETTSAENKAEAEAKRLELVAQMEKELIMENLIKAKGFADVIVTNSSDSINVVVKSAELQATEVAQIVGVVQEQTKADIDNIKIIPVE
ncbi:MAG: SpoIIIAH-like family protein [Christensenellales bacterium]